MREHYTELVEHYFRLGVRQPYLMDSVSEDWYRRVRYYLKELVPDSRALVVAVFGSSERRVVDAIHQVPGQFASNINRLNEIERLFAEMNNLI